MPPEWRAPDDARELDADLLALRREQLAALGRGRVAEPWPGWRPYGAQAVMVVLVLIGVVAVGIGLVVAAPVGLPINSGARPLATSAVSPGTVDALLPDVTVRIGQQDRPVRSLRPAVLALLTSPCGCGEVLHEVADEAGQYGVPLVLVSPAKNPEIPALLQAIRATRAYPAVDPSSVLARAYAARGLTVLLVRADGVVTTVERQLHSGQRFGAALSDLTA